MGILTVHDSIARLGGVLFFWFSLPTVFELKGAQKNGTPLLNCFVFLHTPTLERYLGLVAFPTFKIEPIGLILPNHSTKKEKW